MAGQSKSRTTGYRNELRMRDVLLAEAAANQHNNEHDVGQHNNPHDDGISIKYKILNHLYNSLKFKQTTMQEWITEQKMAHRITIQKMTHRITMKRMVLTLTMNIFTNDTLKLTRATV